MATWKRVALFGFCFGVGAAAAIGLTAWAVYSWNNQPSPLKTWPKITLENIRVQTRLKTEWRDGKLFYQFGAAPLAEQFGAAFDKVPRENDSIGFSIALYDPNGFELCREKMTLTPMTDARGLVTELQDNDSGYGCSSKQYRGATNWNVFYTFPKLESTVASRGTESSTAAANDVVNRVKKADDLDSPAIKVITAQDMDSLTGFDLLDGHMETRAGHTFLVSRQGERITASTWTASSSLKYTCYRRTGCLIENTANGEAVHATLIR